MTNKIDLNKLPSALIQLTPEEERKRALKMEEDEIIEYIFE